MTFKERVPNILVKSLDFMRRRWKEYAKHERKHSPNSASLAEYEEQCKQIIGEISKLRYEIMTNKPLIRLDDPLPDRNHWNNQLGLMIKRIDDQELTYFDSPMLFTECYVYRRLNSFLANRPLFRSFDPFLEQKRAVLHHSIDATQVLSEHLFLIPESLKSNRTTIKEEFSNFLQFCLWGNKADLSLSGGERIAQTTHLFADLAANQSKILCNDSDAIWKFFESWLQSPPNGAKRQFDIVLDNSGFELICDLTFLVMLYQTGLLKENQSVVRFMVKQMPWYVSDTINADLAYTIMYLCKDNQPPTVRQFGEFVRHKFTTNDWKVVIEPYWTYPNDYSDMARIDPLLYQDISKSDCVMFKGDLNYRKLVGDIDWPHTTTFEAALRGFSPTNLISLRTIKFDPVVNLESEEMVESLPDNWFFSGEYALIHFLPKKL